MSLSEERNNLLVTRRKIEGDLSDVRTIVAERQAQLEWVTLLIQGTDDTRGDASNLYVFAEPNMRGEPALSVLRRTILATKADYFDAKVQYTENHPTVLALRDRLDELNEALKHEASGYADYLEALVTAARAKDASLQASLDYINEQLSAFPDREAQLSRLDRTIESLRTNHGALVRRRR